MWRRRHYRVRRGPVPGTFFFSVLDNGVISNEFWRIADAAEDLSWTVLYYAGASPPTIVIIIIIVIIDSLFSSIESPKNQKERGLLTDDVLFFLYSNCCCCVCVCVCVCRGGINGWAGVHWGGVCDSGWAMARQGRVCASGGGPRQVRHQALGALRSGELPLPGRASRPPRVT